MTLHEKTLYYMDKYPYFTYEQALNKAYDALSNLMYQKHTRLRERVDKMLTYENPVFYTLTLTDASLEKYKDHMLYRYAKEWARKYLDTYVGNIDYGSKNGRLHFHIMGNYKELPTHESWSYGNIHFQRIYNDNSKRIARYIIALTKHAEKGTAGKIFRSKKQ